MMAMTKQVMGKTAIVTMRHVRIPFNSSGSARVEKPYSTPDMVRRACHLPYCLKGGTLALRFATATVSSLEAASLRGRPSPPAPTIPFAMVRAPSTKGCPDNSDHGKKRPHPADSPMSHSTRGLPQGVVHLPTCSIVSLAGFRSILDDNLTIALGCLWCRRWSPGIVDELRFID